MKPDLFSTLTGRSRQQVAMPVGNQKWPTRTSITAAVSFALIFATVCSAQSTSEDAPTNETFERRIYFKLPLAQPRFHWCFKDRDKILQGELTLKIQSKETVSEFTIFKEGKFSDDWIPRSSDDFDPRKDERGFYFLFRSRENHKLTREDTATLKLSVPEDLDGHGGDFEGTLKAGTYLSRGRFTIFNRDHDESEFAYLSKEKWDPLWNLEITSNKGWQEEQYDEEKFPLNSGRESYLISFSFNEDGTRSAAIVDHSAKEFYFESFRNHEDFLQYVAENREHLPSNISCLGYGEGFIDFCEKLQKVLTPIVLSYFDGKSLIGNLTIEEMLEAPNYYQIYKPKRKTEIQK